MMANYRSSARAGGTLERKSLYSDRLRSG